ncbi:MAG: NAD(P)H-dependent oxidoreductase [Deltaproteobacteria bacterium]
MTVLVIEGSRRPKSNTGAIARDLATRIAAAGRAAEVWRVPRWSAGSAASDEALARLAAADVVVLIAPSYLDELPAVTQRLLEDVWERRAELRGRAPLFYGIAHSGFPEPIQRRAELRSMRFLAEQMSWIWMGGVGFGGTSPIDGRPLEQAGMFSKQLRNVLPLVAADIAAGRPFSPETVRRSAKSPFPLPRTVLIASINARTRKAARQKRLDLEARAYAGRDQV